MSNEDRDYFKLFTGKSWDEAVTRKVPTADETLNKIWISAKSKYKPRLLGVGEEEVLISEEERQANYHIIGQPRQGKSKLIEDNIRKDIDLGNGLCLLDPSDNGDTSKKILAYCALKGVEKVIYIDPEKCLKLNRIPTLQPLKPYPYINQSVDSVIEALNSVYGVAKQTDNPQIGRNLEALLTVLGNQNLTLNETKHFFAYRDWRDLPFLKDDEDSQIIKSAFRTAETFDKKFLYTAGRLNILRKEPISLMVGANTGIDFVKMISEGWVILVNLYPQKSFTINQARLLGILLISEIIHAIDVLFHAEPEGKIKKVFYLYMDEAARFATPQIKNILDYKGKTGLRFIIAHHGFSQFKDRDVLESIKGGCRIKMMFNISNYRDRLEMVEDLGYGGDIPPILAAYANQNIPKQTMIIKKDKETPVRIRVPDVPDVKISKEKVDSYIEKILSNKWYLTKEKITDQINARSIRKDSKSSQRSSSSHDKSAQSDRVPGRGNPSILENIEKSKSAKDGQTDKK